MNNLEQKLLSLTVPKTLARQEDLAQDVLERITVFSARLYGSRSDRHRQIVEQLREVAKKLK